MKPLSNREAALLSLIAERSKHAYDIHLDIEERSMDYWTEISTSSIYKLLPKLEARKLIESTVRINERNVVQKIYSITPAGKAALQEKIRSLASEWQPSVDPIDVALRNLNLLDRAEAIEALKSYRASLEKTIQGYKELEEFIRNKGGHLANIQLATRRIYMLSGEKDWIENFIREYAHDGSENK